MDLAPVIPVVIGAALAGLFALFGAWVQGRREHARWLRERRYEAFARVQTQVMEMGVLDLEHKSVLEAIAKAATDNEPVQPSARDKAHRNVARIAELKAEQASIGGPLAVLGPHAVEIAYGRLMADWDDSEAGPVAARQLITEMRRALKVRA